MLFLLLDAPFSQEPSLAPFGCVVMPDVQGTMTSGWARGWTSGAGPRRTWRGPWACGTEAAPGRGVFAEIKPQIQHPMGKTDEEGLRGEKAGGEDGGTVRGWGTGEGQAAAAEESETVHGDKGLRATEGPLLTEGLAVAPQPGGTGRLGERPGDGPPVAEAPTAEESSAGTRRTAATPPWGRRPRPTAVAPGSRRP